MSENQVEDLIGYDEIIENSMRLVIFKSLKKVEKEGLPGNHYFIVTFLTNFPESKIPDSLKERYPEEMTIAIQYQFRSLKVLDNHFEISLSFGGKYEKLSVPYNAITSFSDPSINFALKFSISSQEIDDLAKFGNDENNQEDQEEIDLSAKIVSLDAFKKNNPSKK